MVEIGGIIVLEGCLGVELVLADLLVVDWVNCLLLDGVVYAHELAVVAAAVRTVYRDAHRDGLLLLQLTLVLR